MLETPIRYIERLFVNIEVTMRITYIDAALWQATGHHFDWAFRVCFELVRRGHEVEVYCSRDLKDDAAERLGRFNVHKLFSFNAYVNPDEFDPISGALEKQWIGFHTMGAELNQVPESDLWICPTMFSHELMAFARSGKQTPLSFCIHHPPEEDAPWWRLAGKIINSSPSTVHTLGVSIEQNVNNINSVLPQFNPRVFPGPADGNPRHSDSLKTVGFLGAHRSEKGGKVLIVNLIQSCLAKGFSVLVNRTRGLPTAVLTHPLLKAREFSEDFGGLVEECDIVVVPYRWEDYIDRASGLIYHARASGVPVIVPRGATFTADLEEAGSCVVFESLCESDIVTAIDDAATNFVSLKRAALAEAINWEKTNGLGKFVDFLLGSQSSSPSNGVAV